MEDFGISIYSKSNSERSAALRAAARQKSQSRRISLVVLSVVLVPVVAAWLLFCNYNNNNKLVLASLATRNVVYNQELSNYCVGDIYQPALAAGALAPAVVVVHGGAWTTGSKGGPDTQPIVDRLVKEGFVVFDINYRLEGQGGGFPNNANDVKNAVKFLSQKANIYHVNRDKVAILGISAGGQLALLAAYDPTIAHHNINAVVAIAPVTNLVVSDNPMIAALFPKNDLARRLVASPIAYANSGVPTLLIHGTNDSAVPFHQSELLTDALSKNHIPVELEPIARADHNFILMPSRAQEQALILIVRYLKTELHIDAV
jgi:acetyl esterase/lipase